jgi:hypothetical protein
VRAFLGEREISFGKLRPAGVDPVEDVDHHVDGLVLAGDLLLVKVSLEHVPQPGQPPHEGNDPRLGVRMGVQRRDVVLKAHREQRRHVDPARVVAHLGRRVELERLVLHVEPQPRECLLVALEEGGRATAGDPVQRGDPLLAVQDEDPVGGAGRDLAADQRPVGLGLQVSRLPTGQPRYRDRMSPRTWSRFHT